MGQRNTLTIPYSCIQAPYWMSLCVFMGFTAVYLHYLGYDNSETGLVLALGTLLGSVSGPFLASLIDKSAGGRITAFSLMPAVLLTEAAALVMLLLFPQKGFVTSAVYPLFIAVATSVNTLDLRMYTDAVYRGRDIDFGIARGCGSIGYVLMSFILGELCESSSPVMIPAAGLIICAVQFAAFLNYSYRFKRGEGSEKAWQTGKGTDEKGSYSVWAFLRRNRNFSMLLAGTVLIFYSHNVLCSFFINVVENVGGSVGDMGILNGLMALFETPVVLFYSRITKHRKTSSVLIFSFIMFSLKAAAVAVAASVIQLGAALILQAPSFGLYTGAIVLYTDETIAYEDSAKAQSLAFTMTMIATVIASIAAGRQFDVISTGTVMWISCGVCIAGTIIACLGVLKERHLRS